jgi:hypothetical protein
VHAADVASERRWRFQVDGVELTVRRLAQGRWEVLYGGFCRVVSDRLEDAIAVAPGASPSEPWIGEASRCVARTRATVEA